MEWEYLVIQREYVTVTELATELSGLGVNRWELVAVANDRLYLKRQR
jgi:hypothetical protein